MIGLWPLVYLDDSRSTALQLRSFGKKRLWGTIQLLSGQCISLAQQFKFWHSCCFGFAEIFLGILMQSSILMLEQRQT